MHPLGLLPSITFHTILATHMFTDTFRTRNTGNRCYWMRDGRTWRIQQHLWDVVRQSVSRRMTGPGNPYQQPESPGNGHPKRQSPEYPDVLRRRKRRVQLGLVSRPTARAKHPLLP
jgi:hypothetical protein